MGKTTRQLSMKELPTPGQLQRKGLSTKGGNYYLKRFNYLARKATPDFNESRHNWYGLYLGHPLIVKPFLGRRITKKALAKPVNPFIRPDKAYEVQIDGVPVLTVFNSGDAEQARKSFSEFMPTKNVQLFQIGVNV